jgi:hypothetical protein
MLIFQFVGALAIAAPAPPVSTQLLASSAQAHSAVAVSPTTAAALARTVAPADITIALEIDQARKAILSLPAIDEDAKQLESEFPGLYAAMWAAVEPEMRRSSEADFPSYWSALEKMYGARLTEQEAQAVLTFFRSPTGQKLLRGMYAAMDTGPMFEQMIKSDSSTVGAKQMQTAVDAAKAKAVQQMGPEDEATLMALVASIDLEKFRALGAETQKITLEWVNKEDPEGEERLSKMMREAMGNYMSSHTLKK